MWLCLEQLHDGRHIVLLLLPELAPPVLEDSGLADIPHPAFPPWNTLGAWSPLSSRVAQGPAQRKSSRSARQSDADARPQAGRPLALAAGFQLAQATGVSLAATKLPAATRMEAHESSPPGELLTLLLTPALPLWLDIFASGQKLL